MKQHILYVFILHSQLVSNIYGNKLFIKTERREEGKKDREKRKDRTKEREKERKKESKKESKKKTEIISQTSA